MPENTPFVPGREVQNAANEAFIESMKLNQNDKVKKSEKKSKKKKKNGTKAMRLRAIIISTRLYFFIIFTTLEKFIVCAFPYVLRNHKVTISDI